VPHRLPISKVGWDRKFRIVMVVVVAMVGYIGLKAGLALYAARTQAAQESSLVSSLEKQHRRLVAEKRALNQQGTIMRDARQLGLVSAGERPYAIVGSSQH
jgi:cell division protein FtsB